MEKILVTKGITSKEARVIHGEFSMKTVVPTYYGKFSTDYPFDHHWSIQALGSTFDLSRYQQA